MKKSVNFFNKTYINVNKCICNGRNWNTSLHLFTFIFHVLCLLIWLFINIFYVDGINDGI